MLAAAGALVLEDAGRLPLALAARRALLSAHLRVFVLACGRSGGVIIVHRSSFIGHRSSVIIHRSSFIHHALKYIQMRTASKLTTANVRLSRSASSTSGESGKGGRLGKDA